MLRQFKVPFDNPPPFLKPFLATIAWIYIPLFLIVPILWPEQKIYIFYGMGLGIFYLLSLLLNAFTPLDKLQVVFSLTRMVLLAYLIVCGGNLNVPEITVVICSFLSYKGVLLVESIRQCTTRVDVDKNSSEKLAG